MPPPQPLQLVSATVVATLYVLVSVLSIAAAMRLRSDRRPPLLLGWAMGQHVLVELLGPGPLGRVLVGREPWALWTSSLVDHFIALPWALLLMALIGTGWKNSIRITARLFLAAACVAVFYDLWTGRPEAAAPAMRVVNATGAAGGFLNLFWVGSIPQLRVLRAGFLAFLALVVHDAAANAGWLPWTWNSGPSGVLVLNGAIVATVIARGLRARGDLHAIEHELETARRIQLSLLPEEPPRLEGADIAFRYQPATAVAGDIFDFIGAGRRSAGILVADVSGHGVPAALIASMVKVAAAAQEPHAADPARVLAGIHQVLARQLPRGQFVTAVYVYVDLDRAVIRHASAGHPPALLCRAVSGEVIAGGRTGPLLIGFAPADYPVTELSIAPGDRVVLYTDGVIEAMRPDDEMFGVERLSSLVATARNGAESLVSGVLDAVSAFTGGRASLEDDCTLVALEVGAPQAVGAARG